MPSALPFAESLVADDSLPFDISVVGKSVVRMCVAYTVTHSYIS